MKKLQGFAAAAAAGLAPVACGDDGDERSRTDEGRQQAASQGAPDTAAAQRLETYLNKNRSTSRRATRRRVRSSASLRRATGS
jgi:hypothetical protein